MIDLRSDTLTKPTNKMRQEMYNAEVGDSGRVDSKGKGEDPTVNLLEELATEKTGKEDAYFVPSGTMGNLIALMTYCNRGEAAGVNKYLHIYKSEKGVFSDRVGGIIPVYYEMDLDYSPSEKNITDIILKDKVKAICLENTNNFLGGRCITRKKISDICKISKNHEVRVHMDGARIFNASIYLETPVHELIAETDTVMFCLSKGLGAPFGSMLCGSQEIINTARTMAKLLGGGMRQAGIYAAAGIVAIKEGSKRLSEDHENAAILARKIYNDPAKIKFNPDEIQTNIVIIDVSPSGLNALEVQNGLLGHGLKVHKMSDQNIRLVTYNGISKKDVLKAAEIINNYFVTA